MAQDDDRVKAIQEATQNLWDAIGKTLEYYNEKSCQCAFPRFRQYTSIDCVDTRDSYYMSETEGFIAYAKEYFTVTSPDGNGQSPYSTYTCNTCGSIFDFEWQDFSIHVNRSCLKLREHKVADIGAAPIEPIPFHVGPFGHSFPKENFQKWDLEPLIQYFRELKPE